MSAGLIVCALLMAAGRPPPSSDLSGQLSALEAHLPKNLAVELAPGEFGSVIAELTFGRPGGPLVRVETTARLRRHAATIERALTRLARQVVAPPGARVVRRTYTFGTPSSLPVETWLDRLRDGEAIELGAWSDLAQRGRCLLGPGTPEFERLFVDAAERIGRRPLRPFDDVIEIHLGGRVTFVDDVTIAKVALRGYAIHSDAVFGQRMTADDAGVSLCIERLSARAHADLVQRLRTRFACVPSTVAELVIRGRYDFPEDRRFVSVDGTATRACALDDRGSLVCCGRRTAPEPTPSGAFAAIATSDTHSCARRRSGEVVCWGEPREYSALRARLEAPFDSKGESTCATERDGRVGCRADADR